MKFNKLSFRASKTAAAQAALHALIERYGDVPAAKADAIVALGGDGFILASLHATRSLNLPVYGMNQGTVGFLMNEFVEEGLMARLEAAEAAKVHPLHMAAEQVNGHVAEALAINEVSLLRSGPQAAKLRISVDGKVRLAELVCDGALVCTPAGSTAYNYSAHGPILPVGADILALTAMSAFRPRRWRGALLPATAKVVIEVMEHDKRPVNAVADSTEVRSVVRVEIRSEPNVTHTLLFDPGHGLEERLVREQFV